MHVMNQPKPDLQHSKMKGDQGLKGLAIGYSMSAAPWSFAFP